MKIAICKDCGRDELVPDFTPEPWICDVCQALHSDNSVQCMEIENGLNQDDC